MSEKFKQILSKYEGISSEEYSRAEKHAKEKSILIVHSFEELNIGDTNKIFELYSRLYNLKFVYLEKMSIAPNILKLLPSSIVRKYKVIPVDKVGNHLILAMMNPSDLKLLDMIRFKTKFLAKPVLASKNAISKVIEKKFRPESIAIDVDASVEVGVQKKDQVRASIGDDNSQSGDDGPIIKLFNQILVQCLARDASDIHIEPYEKIFRVRMRIDGALSLIVSPPKNYIGPLITRVKIMAGLNIAQKRLPQDGNIRVSISEKPVDFRVNTVPTQHGEKVVLRILDKSALQVDMTKLGFEADDFKKFFSSIQEPYGMVLVTGPTGSGKTTTLYSALSQLNKISKNIMTAEDPVEYNLEGINQVHVNPSIGLDFSSALRAFLRQDPDIIMVGEIRDKETGEIGIKAALTGHLVLSTLHTNSAADTIVRLAQMGLESFNLVAALNSIVAQRLARKLCPSCKIEDDKVGPEQLIDLGINSKYAQSMVVYRGKGCSSCNKTGYKGRTAIHEVMVINDKIRDGIMRGLSSMDLKKIALETGMRTLRQNALNKLARGETDVGEVVANTSSDHK